MNEQYFNFYVINVAKKSSGYSGRYVHYFSTDKKSLRREDDAKELLNHFIKLFPEPEYRLSISGMSETNTYFDVTEFSKD